MLTLSGPAVCAARAGQPDRTPGWPPAEQRHAAGAHPQAEAGAGGGGQAQALQAEFCLNIVILDTKLFPNPDILILVTKFPLIILLISELPFNIPVLVPKFSFNSSILVSVTKESTRRKKRVHLTSE